LDPYELYAIKYATLARTAPTLKASPSGPTTSRVPDGRGAV
jgi:hypothetical protein